MKTECFMMNDIVTVKETITEEFPQYKRLLNKEYKLRSIIKSESSPSGLNYRVDNVYISPIYLELVPKK